MLPIGATILLGSFKTLRFHDFYMVAGTFGWAVSFLLRTWCHAALMIESRKSRLF